MTTLAAATPVAVSVIPAVAALSGVLLAQAIAWWQRSLDDKRRRRKEMAQAIAPALSLIMDAINQVEAHSRSNTSWYAQPEWTKLRAETWPVVRTLLLTQASEVPDALQAVKDLALKVQQLLNDDGTDRVTLSEWQGVMAQIEALQRQTYR